MDILIMILLLVIALLVWRGANRGVIIGLWVIGVVAMIGLSATTSPRFWI